VEAKPFSSVLARQGVVNAYVHHRDVTLRMLESGVGWESFEPNLPEPGILDGSRCWLEVF
jgi:hypothetical protein